MVYYLSYLQFIVFSFGTQFLSLLGQNFEESATITSCVQCVFWYILLAFGMRSRSHVARLPDEDLSKYLTKDVIMGRMFVGLGQVRTKQLRSARSARTSLLIHVGVLGHFAPSYHRFLF